MAKQQATQIAKEQGQALLNQGRAQATQMGNAMIQQAKLQGMQALQQLPQIPVLQQLPQMPVLQTPQGIHVLQQPQPEQLSQTTATSQPVLVQQVPQQMFPMLQQRTVPTELLTPPVDTGTAGPKCVTTCNF